MTPLEYTGLAIANEFTRIFPGSRPTKEHRELLARAALLALAEHDFKGPNFLTDEAFKARLRSIVSEGGDDVTR